MKRINIFIIAFLFLSCWRSFAQEVKVIYQMEKENSQYHVTLSMQSASEATVNVRAVNFSLALPEGCQVASRSNSLFETAWTDFLLNETRLAEVALEREGKTFVGRWQYGVADPDLPGTEPIMLPKVGEEALPVMELTLKGSCEQGVYLEHVSENRLNQIGGGDFKPVAYTIETGSRQGEPAPGLELSLVAYPNPVVDRLRVDFSAPMEANLKLELLDLTGRQLFSQEQGVEPGTSYDVTVEMASLPAATYFVRLLNLDSGETLKSLKVVKQ